YLVDEAFVPKNYQAFAVILAILVAGGALSIAANACGDYAIGRLSGLLTRTLRSELFTHLQKQSTPFYRRYRVGDLVTRFVSDMASIDRVIRGACPFTLRELLSVLLGLGTLLVLEWKLT